MAVRAQQQRNMQSATDQGEASPSQPTIPCVAGDGAAAKGAAPEHNATEPNATEAAPTDRQPPPVLGQRRS